MTLEIKRPKSLRMEFTFQGMTGVQAYDGKSGWAISPFGGKKDPEPMSPDDTKEAEEEADIDGPLVDYKSKGHTVELVGKEKIEGSDAYKLKVTLKGGTVRYQYLDADSFLEIKTEAKRKVQGQEVEGETIYGNYQEFGGLLFPMSIEMKAKGMPAGQTITLDKVEINPSLGDDLFKMPEKKAEAAPAKQ